MSKLTNSIKSSKAGSQLFNLLPISDYPSPYYVWVYGHQGVDIQYLQCEVRMWHLGAKWIWRRPAAAAAALLRISNLRAADQRPSLPKHSTPLPPHPASIPGHLHKCSSSLYLDYSRCLNIRWDYQGREHVAWWGRPPWSSVQTPLSFHFSQTDTV